MDVILGIVKESFFLMNKMSPYLLFGFLFAGLLHVFIDTATIARHLGKSNFLSVVKASLFGIPLPLCSCGVIPAASSLRREGASKGSIVSFLISTPTTGVDSILATYSLLGGLFAVYRVIASFMAGVFSGVLTNILVRGEREAPAKEEKSCRLCGENEQHRHSVPYKIKEVFRYAFGELLSDIGKWLLLGILIGGVISFFMPDKFIHTYLGSGWKAMFVMLVIGIPMYVCATGSIPIAAALMLKGMNPGAAFVFLMAGPATNAIGITVIAKEIGKKAVAIYLFSIAVSSLALGMLLDKVWHLLHIKGFDQALKHAEFLPGWIGYACTFALLLLIGYNFFHGMKNKVRKENRRAADEGLDHRGHA